MPANFSFSPNNNPEFNFKKPQAPKLRKVEQQVQQKVEQKPNNNPFENLFTFKAQDIVYDKVMKSSQMLGFLKAQKVAGQFMDLTKPEHQVGKRLNYEI